MSRSLLMFAFEAIVFIKEFNLFTPIGADLNQCFFGAVCFRVVYSIPKWNGASSAIMFSGRFSR